MKDLVPFMSKQEWDDKDVNIDEEDQSSENLVKDEERKQLDNATE
jgi:hypothetical protein